MSNVAPVWVFGELAGLRARAAPPERMRPRSCIVAAHNTGSTSSLQRSGYARPIHALSATFRRVAVTQA